MGISDKVMRGFGWVNLAGGRQMRKSWCFIAALALVALLPGAVSASVIDFATLTGSNGDTFTTYTENGFTVTATTGTWDKAFLFGNPVPDIFGDTGSLSVTITDGGSLFSFSSVDLASNEGISPFSLTGNVGGSSIYTVNGIAPNSFTGSAFVFSTVLSNHSTPIDTLVISINAANALSFNIDNIVVSSSVPEPGALGYMLLSGLAAGAFALRKRASTNCKA
jgi:hypothetical protein